MFPEGMDMNALLEQAQQMQVQLQQARDDLQDASFSGTSGGGLVEATVTGGGVLTGLVIKPEAIDPDDAEAWPTWWWPPCAMPPRRPHRKPRK